MTQRRVEGWWDRAACRGTDTEDWFAQDDDSRYPVDPALLRRICAGCPVRQDCLDDALRTESRYARYGIRAGLMPYQRAALGRRP